MAKVTNAELINSLRASTEQDKIDWQPTAVTDQFAASFGGKWTVLIDRTNTGSGPTFYVEVKNSEGEEVIRITDNEIAGLETLFEMVRRSALGIDEELRGLLNEIQNPQK